jgi:protein CpxP
MKKSIAISTLCLTLATAIMPAFAQSVDKSTTEVNTASKWERGTKGGRHGGMKGGHGERFKALNLTEEQKTKMASLKDQFKQTIKPKREELMTHRKALGDLLTSDTIDRSAVQSEQDKINALSNDMANSKLNYRISFNENLTTEQRKQMRDMHANFGKKHGHRPKA